MDRLVVPSSVEVLNRSRQGLRYDRVRCAPLQDFDEVAGVPGFVGLQHLVKRRHKEHGCTHLRTPADLLQHVALDSRSDRILVRHRGLAGGDHAVRFSEPIVGDEVSNPYRGRIPRLLHRFRGDRNLLGEAAEGTLQRVSPHHVGTELGDIRAGQHVLDTNRRERSFQIERLDLVQDLLVRRVTKLLRNA